jgi:N-acyl-phosphatidylethanolamine-hydrolysing phospholipase D
MDWWDEAIFSFSSSTFEPYRDERASIESNSASKGQDVDPALVIKIACTPAQHRSGRGIFDHMSTLWASWVVATVGQDEGEAKALKSRGSEGLNGFRCYFGGCVDWLGCF